MYLPKNEGGNFELTPAGTFMARCYRFIDLGSHAQEYQGESKGLKRLVMIGFEIAGEAMEDGRPFSVHKRYTWSTHEKSNMRKDLESWRGAKFNDADFGPGGFDVKNLLGVPCTLTVVHSENDGKQYANIAGIGKAMKGLEVPELVNPKVYISLEKDLFDPEAFNGLSDKLKEFIQGTPEWRKLTAGNAPSYADESGSKSSYDERNPPPNNNFDDNLDEIPF
jgi:hypothetical protein